MRPDVVVITPELTPEAGGVADHTLELVQRWSPLANIHLLVPGSYERCNRKSTLNVQILGQTAAEVADQLRQINGNVLVQYSAYGFHRSGYPRDLIRGLIDWKENTAARLVIMFHEIWTFASLFNPNFIVQQLHRRSLKRFISVSDAVFTTTTSQADHLHSLSDAPPIHVLPAGSNIPRVRASAVERGSGVAVLFGMQLTRVRALETMGQELRSLAAAGKIKKIVSVGHDPDPNLREYERKLLSELNLAEGFEQRGGLGQAMISQVLSTASFGIFGQNELSCTKSGSFMAYAAHELNVLAPFTARSKVPPACWTVASVELLEGLGENDLHRRAERLRMWQEKNCSWEVIATRLGRALAIDAGLNNPAA